MGEWRVPIIAPSILSADFLNLEKEIHMLNNSACDWIHVDIMDGHFVPNISFGFPVMKALQASACKPLDVHLMIDNPMTYAKKFADLGASNITIHYETEKHLHRCLTEISKWGVRAGVAVNPHTPIAHLENILPYAGLILIMSVNPGFGGQEFIPETYNKIRQLVKLKETYNYNFIIEVDGGINENNAQTLVNSGAEALVAGNAVFKSASPHYVISNLKKCSVQSSFSHDH